MNTRGYSLARSVCCTLMFALNYIFFKEMLQRLYIGGLFHGISEVEVTERFGKFGSISNTSIKTKHDINGNVTFRLALSFSVCNLSVILF